MVMRRYRGTFGWLTRLATSIRNMAIPSLAACGALSASNAVRAARATSFRRPVATSAASSAADLSAAAGNIDMGGRSAAFGRVVQNSQSTTSTVFMDDAGRLRRSAKCPCTPPCASYSGASTETIGSYGGPLVFHQWGA